MPGHFVISLDFELFWGVRDHRTIEDYGENIKGVREAIPMMLNLFKTYNIRATFATVGFLFFETKQHLLQHLPEQLPHYTDTRLNPYGTYMDQVGSDEASDPYHFGKSLVQLIKKTPGQEIASHTFSHYYCLEEGQSQNTFEHDLRAAINIAHEYGIKINSIVFPRNQFNRKYLSVCRKLNIYVYRGNQNHWMYAPRKRSKESLLLKIFRFTDTYFNISGHHTFPMPTADNEGMVNVPASRFLRPWNKKLSMLEPLKKNRLKKSMLHAARNNQVFHLWWHPHNFGAHTEKNISMLEELLIYYCQLNKQYGFISSNMGDFLLKNIS
ncbi:MAG: polysaccharide deacetylase family protein [Cytophagaceae bacterium]|nr:polysaccharide deacetylase family protein [Cytophagaceae bacterium]MDW8455805.1 polysaccharide deacetylase family protein [Cytophagaceae bacterium]